MQQRRLDPMSQDEVLQVLSSLASADLAALGRLYGDLARAFPTLYVTQEGPPTFGLSPGFDYTSLDLVKALAAASSRGLRLITSLFGSTTSSSSSSSSSSSCLYQHRHVLSCVVACLTLCGSFMSLYTIMGSNSETVNFSPETRRKQVELAVAITSTGLLTTLPAACTATACMLQQLLLQQQEQQLQDPPSAQQRQQSKQSETSERGQRQELQAASRMVIDVAAMQLALYDGLINKWPTTSSSSGSSLSSSRELGSAAMPAVQLAMAVLVASGGRAAYAKSVMLFVATLCGCLRSDILGAAGSACAGLAAARGSLGGGSSSSSMSLSPAVRQLLQSEQLLKLLASSQAMYAQVLQHNSTSSSSSQNNCRARSSSKHGGGGRDSNMPDVASIAPEAAADVLRAVGFSWTRSAATLSSDDRGGDSGGMGKQLYMRMEYTEAVLDDIAVVVQHVVQSSASMQADKSSRGGGNNAGDSAGSSSSNTTASTTISSAASIGSSGQQPAPSKSIQQRQRQLVPLLAPWAVVQVELMQLTASMSCKLAGLGALVALMFAAEQQDAAACAAVKHSLLLPVLQLLTKLWQQDGPSSSSRVDGSAETPASSSGGSDSTGNVEGMKDVSTFGTTSVLVLLVCNDDSCKAELAAALSSDPALLPTLEASCRCLAMHTRSAQPLPVTATDVAEHAADLAAALGDAPGFMLNSSAELQQQQQQQLYALLVTCLKCGMRGLKGAQQQKHSTSLCTASALDAALVAVKGVAGASTKVLSRLAPASLCMEALARCLGAAGLHADVQQQLQQQQAAALQQLQSLQGAAGLAGAVGSSAQQQQQLRDFAQAVAARIPLSTACNNPGCVSLAQRSELVLVGGKSCVCGRCRAARYCCKACQVEHWRWHKALCREMRKPAAEAAGAAAQ
ncbi:hypothetical protein COO60DRAFT_429511 [Scenedesmus sp. NREL 46B-D3]|nr:hypothetical protein COO60DRAFT_429511 [Scenedesmus sp. NREL 46B-D3]